MNENEDTKPVVKKKKTPSQRFRDHRKTALIKCLKNNKGNIKHACETAGVTPPTYYNWIANDPDFREKLETMEKLKINLAESKLDEHIYNDEDARISLDATKFYLERKGAKYGWSKEDVQGNKEVKPLNIIVNNNSDNKDDDVIDI